MSSLSTRPRLIIGHGSKKNAVQNLEPPPPNLGTLSPDPQSDVLPPFPSAGDSKESNFLTVGKYILIKQNEKSESYLAINTTTQEELTCKVFPRRKYWESVTPYWHVDSHPHVAPYREIILGDTKAYIFFPKGHGDLHSYVREKKRLREDEAKTLFRQIVSTVIHCHDNGVILRDLKLRKFIFADEDRTQLQLEGLEDAVVLEEAVSDTLKDKHGCPAYVSPEILSATESGYSGKSADVWSLGVMLYTMLVGRYPFHDAQPLALFGKIRRGQFHVPDALTPKARCLIRCLLRRDPDERMPSNEILNHPWFKSAPTFQRPASANQHSKLQVVPEWASASSPGPFDYL